MGFLSPRGHQRIGTIPWHLGSCHHHQWKSLTEQCPPKEQVQPLPGLFWCKRCLQPRRVFPNKMLQYHSLILMAIASYLSSFSHSPSYVLLLFCDSPSWKKINAEKKLQWFMQGSGWQTRSAAGLQVGERRKGSERRKGEVFFQWKLIVGSAWSWCVIMLSIGEGHFCFRERPRNAKSFPLS